MAYTFDSNLISDLYKEVTGCRPSRLYFEDWADMSDAEKQAEWDSLIAMSEANLERQIKEDAAAVAAFEARVAATVELGARDEATAIRWILEGMDLSENDLRYGAGYVCFQLGLPYSMAVVFEATVALLLEDCLEMVCA